MSWIFRYIRAGREEIDMGLYNTKEESEKHRKNMKFFGAIVLEDSIEVSEDYKLYKGEKLRWN